MPNWPFVPGRSYSRRADIHEKYGGQEQGGIATPAGHNVIFAFTGASGSKHGYADDWQPDGTFHYCGEGQVGDTIPPFRCVFDPKNALFGSNR